MHATSKVREGRKGGWPGWLSACYSCACSNHMKPNPPSLSLSLSSPNPLSNPPAWWINLTPNSTPSSLSHSPHTHVHAWPFPHQACEREGKREKVRPGLGSTCCQHCMPTRCIQTWSTCTSYFSLLSLPYLPKHPLPSPPSVGHTCTGDTPLPSQYCSCTSSQRAVDDSLHPSLPLRHTRARPLPLTRRGTHQ
jgi:hypothetical protein